MIMHIMVDAQAMDILMFLLSVIAFLALVGAALALLLRRVVFECERDLT